MADTITKKKSAQVIALRDWPLNNVVSIQDFQRQRALRNLRRLTGLEFETYPLSLIKPE